MTIFFFVLAVLACVGGCASRKEEKKPTGPLILLSADRHPDFYDDRLYDGLEEGIEASLRFIDRASPTRKFRFGDDLYTVDRMRRSLATFRDFIRNRPQPGDLRRFIAENYLVYKSSGAEDTGKVLFTGYYEPTLRGSRISSEIYSHPVYGPPDDLAVVDLTPFSSKYKGEKIVGRWNGRTFVPYHDRLEIDFKGALAGRTEPILYVDDLVDLFFLQVQGSGRVVLEEGGTVNLHYHSTNGRAYRSIGKYLIDQGEVERSEMSMQKIRQYLNEHPEEMATVMGYNPSYVFFETVSEGPLGALGVALVPGRAVATDRKIFPDAALTFIETEKPLLKQDGEIARWVGFSRFLLNQDTGGAIRGPGRADVFWGNGGYAEVAAGHMKHPGNMYFLVLKPQAEASQ